MDIKQLRNNKGRLCALIMGLISGIYGFIISLFSALALISSNNMYGLQKYTGSLGVTVGVLLILTSAIYIVGASLVLKRRIAAGVIMIVTSVPLLTISIIDTHTFAGLLLIEIVCLAAAIIAFIPLSYRYLKSYIAKKQYQETFNEYVAGQVAKEQYQQQALANRSEAIEQTPPSHIDTTNQQ